jgi:hypothetical protein
MIPKGEQHHTLVSLAGSMRRRGMDADEIEAALMVTNAKRLEDPAPPETSARSRRASRSTRPPTPSTAPTWCQADPVARSPRWRSASCSTCRPSGEDPAARVFGKGSTAAVEIDISNGETMTFGTLREMMRPQA